MVESFLEELAVEGQVVSETSPEHKAVPVFVHFPLADKSGFFGDELLAPNVAVGSHVEASLPLHNVAGNVLKEFTHLISIAPAVDKDVIVTQIKPAGNSGFLK